MGERKPSSSSSRACVVVYYSSTSSTRIDPTGPPKPPRPPPEFAPSSASTTTTRKIEDIVFRYSSSFGTHEQCTLSSATDHYHQYVCTTPLPPRFPFCPFAFALLFSFQKTSISKFFQTRYFTLLRCCRHRIKA